MRGKEFKINPYDPCAANKIIGGKKTAVCWSSYNLKVSDVDTKEVPNIMEYI